MVYSVSGTVAPSPVTPQRTPVERKAREEMSSVSAPMSVATPVVGLTVTNRRLPLPLDVVTTTANKVPSLGRAVMAVDLNKVKPASVTGTWLVRSPLAGLI